MPTPPVDIGPATLQGVGYVPTANLVSLAPLSATLQGVGTIPTALLAVPVPLASTTLQGVGTFTASINSAQIIGAIGDWELRVYDRNGLRKRILQEWVSELEFEVLERGGFGTGSIQFLATWEELQLAGNERADVYLFGKLMYRGWLRVAQNELASPAERGSPTMYGLQERLGKLQARCRYAYSAPVDLSQVFTDIVNDHVKISSRMPGIIVDAQIIGPTTQQFDPVGKSVSQALNALCDMAPAQCIWGVDVNDAGSDRIYFRPRNTAVAKRYSIGGNVESFVYPRDSAAVVNRLYIKGGKVAQPNFVTNGSFEHPLPNSETVGNLLLDYSFELNTGWTLSGGASRKQVGDVTAVGGPRTGSWWLELDTNGEKAEQTVNVDYGVILTASFWARRETPTIARQVKCEVDGLNASNAVVTTFTVQAYTDPGDTGVYRKFYSSTVDFSGFPTVTKARFRVQTNGGSASNDGVLVDDCALYETNGVANSGWAWSLHGAAYRNALDWKSHEHAAYEGCYSVKAWAGGISSSADYLELRTSLDARMTLKPGQQRTLIMRLATAVAALPADVTIGFTEYKSDGTVAATTESATISVNSTDWGIVTLNIAANANTASCEVFIRIRSGHITYIDGVMVIDGTPPSEFYTGQGVPAYWEGDSYEKRIDVKNAVLLTAVPTPISSGAAASIDNYDEREVEESNSGVVDFDTAVAFAAGYFNAHALPKTQARLRVILSKQSELLDMSGTVKLLNIPSPPPALFPSRQRYTIGGSDIVLDADLGNEIPDLADLLVLTQQKTKLGIV